MGLSSRQGLRSRRARICLDGSIALFGFLIIILCGVGINQYPIDPDYGGNTVLAMCVLGVPGGVMALFCSVDILIHFFGPRNGIHRKTTLGILVFCLIGTFIAYLMAIVFRYIAGDETEGVGLGLSKYQDGDEYFFSSWALAVVSWLCHFVLCVVVGIQGKTSLNAIKNKKTGNNSTV